MLVKLQSLPEENVLQVIELLFNSQVTGSQNREEIREFITGRYFDSGRYFLVNLQEDRVLATVGAVIAEAENKEIFVTAMSCSDGHEECIEPMTRQLLNDLTSFGNCSIKLGVRDGQKVPQGFPESLGFTRSYSLLRMIFAGSLPDTDAQKSVELCHLKPENLKHFVEVTNSSFAGTPNAASLDIDDATRLLNRDDMICGLFKHQNEIKGSFELKLVESVGWIDSIGILPQYRGKGLGKAFVAKLILKLNEGGFSKVKLSVISNNEKAYGLYKKMGFEVERCLSDWYVI
ncbi:MAG: hypothetical protein CVV42_14245 [Candidatus Riflebacteria bacterium HGW-Riflebacteria-2]|jgi:ribosomal protein S18 acetylase RimI-like enzyme|nr:MAG: hypothetical protein CVV42_14245 [Candidatus Riflebacteria bacterium HGW-Riflebacteria-2]